ncbi:hypothetical protein [Alistipes sp. An66]|uniref:hypothetical protein n=1 Tax=Alistipes sp. An66 TaxID=1965650 RepID=UPI0011778AFE|nr:hypothetical protein [Alistipes sp. An66]
MKKLISLLNMLLLLSLVLQAQAQVQDHLIRVKRFHDYGRDYLTIIDPKLYVDPVGMVTRIYGYNFYSLQDDPVTIGIGYLVKEINGRSTKEMDEDEFYQILDNHRDSVLLTLWKNCSTKPYQIVLHETKRPDLFNLLGITSSDFLKARDITPDYMKNRMDKRKKEFDRTKTYCTELIDKDFDWFFVSTYDFMLEGNDPLMDKTILEHFVSCGLPSHWKRDTEHPDVLISISKNADETISSTYVPPTSRVVNTGSKMTSQYNFLSKGYDYITRQQNRVIHEGGYTETTKDTNIFLELSILDTKRIDDPNQTTPPIIWQMTLKRHVLNADFNILDEYMAYASWSAKIPTVYDRPVHKSITAYYSNVEMSGRTIVSIRENSSAQKMGLQVGDEFIKGKAGKKWVTDLGTINSYFHYNCSYKVRRNGKIVIVNGTVCNLYGDIIFKYWLPSSRFEN